MPLTRAEPGHRSSQMRGPLPVHLQISEMLIREIAAGRLADGARLPPEREMAANLGIAVGTLRRALADLTEKGLLDRVQGSGNYIRARGDLLGVYAFFRLECIGGGGLPTAEVLSVERLPKPAGLPEFGSASEAHRIRRLRRLDSEPAAVEEIWLDAGRAERLKREELSESLYLHYRLALGFSIVRAEDLVSVGPAPDWAPADFRPPPGTVVGFIERVAWAGDGASVEYSRSWFDPDVARYVTRFK
ncbi:GntR family transcriptional regulator [Mesorhizobium sp. ES1-3]|uniref:GntR family transcriptional regulator n=1 Tax=Mesorhizobium sp. ES1-3 TaxID=2876628 RepID=UPI001CC9823F|nr:GntR family transcriptional regulator [Mesorhizobium sp. ES1-3]MBZ9672327.1 GntR family transcriptional regulator [Mesorhizobium sp. ES1-3]